MIRFALMLALTGLVLLATGSYEIAGLFLLAALLVLVAEWSDRPTARRRPPAWLNHRGDYACHGDE